MTKSLSDIDDAPTQEIVNLLTASKAIVERYYAANFTTPDKVKFTIMAREDRKLVAQELHEKGLSVRQIAEITGASKSTIAADVQPRTEPVQNRTAPPPGINRLLLNTGDNEWYTPAKYVELARQVLGELDLDPASNDVAQQTIKAARYFTAEADGLKHEWHGRVWLNPPYAQPLVESFINKLVAEHSAGRVTAAILLVNNCTDAAWFHAAVDACDAFCFTRGRIKFEKPDGIAGSPTQGQAFFYFGADASRFADIFADVGFVQLTRACPRCGPYNAADDFAKSIDVAYEAVRERVAGGGPTWTPPKASPVDDGIPEFLQRKPS